MLFRTASLALALSALLTLLGCGTVPATLDLSLRRASQADKFLVELQPPAQPAAINQMHSWRIKLMLPAGAPVAHAHIRVDGDMPQHGHGLPTQPRVTAEPEPGVYQVDGMKFNMGGWWEIKLAIEADGVTDHIAFNTIVPAPAAGG